MKKAKGKISPEELADKADRGEDVTKYFDGPLRKHPGHGSLERRQKDIQRVNVDFTKVVLAELDAEAERMNVSRQAIIKMFVREKLIELRLAFVKNPRKNAV